MIPFYLSRVSSCEIVSYCIHTLKFVDYVEEVLSLMLILSSSCLLLILKALTFQKMNLSSLGKVLPLLLKPAGQFIDSTLSVLACEMAVMVSYLICHQMFIIIIAIVMKC